VAVATLVLLVTVAGALATPAAGGDLDPDSPYPRGSRAVARILAAHGVSVEVVHRAEELRPDPDVTLLVTDPRFTPYGTLLALAGTPADVVLLEPDAVTLQALDLAVVPDGHVPARTVEPACADPDAAAAGSVRAGGLLYRRTVADVSGGGGVAVCYPETTGAGNGSVVVAERDGRRLTALGQPDILRNRYLADEGNAALALRLLGRHTTLQWYLPDPAEVDAGQAPTLGELLPPWSRWVPLQLAVVALVVALWRGRRFGPLVSEPLPVLVRAAETPEGRARLYRQARARRLAAAALRTATARRLAGRLPATSPEALADRVAAATGRQAGSVHSVLLGAPPPDDAALVRLAGDLVRIEQDVSNPTTKRDG
jgi:hypothetical protein